MRRPVLAAAAFVAGAAVWHHRERLNAALDPAADAIENLVDRAVWAAEKRFPAVTTVLDALFADEPSTAGKAQAMQLYTEQINYCYDSDDSST